MILPIVAYGSDVLRKVCRTIDAGYPDLQKLISDMWETMYASSGVGLAAPQINRDIRLFVVDSEQLFHNIDEEETMQYSDKPGVKKVFINAKIIELGGEEWAYNEGCLSIPRIRADVFRHQAVTMHYYDENWQSHTESFHGITARVILHEYDHIEGKLFIDYMKPLKRKLLKGKLDDISKGKINIDYRMLFSK
jgi:peptide deformylase